MKDLNQIERIKIKLNLAKNTDSFFEVFGADSHRYRLDVPIDIKEVEIFEKNYNISLPDEYKVFLTQIGNGGNEYNSVTGNSGTGPDYGIFKLGHKYHFMANPTQSTLRNHLSLIPIQAKRIGIRYLKISLKTFMMDMSKNLREFIQEFSR